MSLPGITGEVKRSAMVKVEALNSDGKRITVEGEGLLAIALCHEIDHLNGILFKDKVIRFVNKEELTRKR